MNNGGGLLLAFLLQLKVLMKDGRKALALQKSNLLRPLLWRTSEGGREGGKGGGREGEETRGREEEREREESGKVWT